MRLQPLALVMILGALVFATGCSSISDAVTSPSRWLGDSSRALGDSSQGSADSSDAFSRSSSGDDEDEESLDEARFRDDVRLAARAWARRDGDRPELAREIAAIAERYGLVDWPDARATWSGAASGLHEAGWPAARVDATLDALGRAPALSQRSDAAL